MLLFRTILQLYCFVTADSCKAERMKSLHNQFFQFVQLNLFSGKLKAYLGMAFIVLIFFVYQILAYRGVSSTHPGAFLVVVSYLPIIVLILIMLWKTKYRNIGFVAIAAGFFALWYYQATLVNYLSWTYMVQRSCIFALSAFAFGITLLPGRIPMISRIAELVHGPLNVKVAQYTRQVTIAWTSLFGFMTFLPLIVFEFSPHPLFFLMTNAITMGLLVSMMFAEYTVRCRIIPVGERAGMVEALHAFFLYSDADAALSKEKPRNGNG
ncbi:membrane protein [Acidithiobacillus thiooxidans ATCC 19377]|jgi:uncharacterized membrane protein|uniref:Membrane protein n=2 Tax=Acidithiobacillus thiooxidans TaxID=930 RepID=A0A5P9XLY8_ACITH|nr:membrane protein [Acidithiobacillus thiooxidans ATCC 19377]